MFGCKRMAFLPTLVDMLVEILAGGCRLVKVGRIEALEMLLGRSAQHETESYGKCKKF